MQVVKEGEDAVFTAVVSGAPTPEIAWLKDKKTIAPSDRLKMDYNPDTHTCTMRIVKATQDDIGVYSCRASNPAGKATCTANVVVVREYPRQLLWRHFGIKSKKTYEDVSSQSVSACSAMYTHLDTDEYILCLRQRNCISGQEHAQ